MGKVAIEAGTIVAKEIYARYVKASEDIQSLQTLPISMSEQLLMPIGHPRLNVIYVGNSSIPTQYIPISDFHKVMLESRITELFTILMHLGAKEIIIEVEDIQTTNIKEKLDTNSTKVSSSHDATISLEYNFNKSKYVYYKGNFSGGEVQSLQDDLI